jgi:hypothetical protein
MSVDFIEEMVYTHGYAKKRIEFYHQMLEEYDDKEDLVNLSYWKGSITAIEAAILAYCKIHNIPKPDIEFCQEIATYWDEEL